MTHNSAAAETDEYLFLSSAPVRWADCRLALVAVTISIVVFLALAPFARVQLAAVPAFIPIYQSALAISDLITAAILFIQFNILRARALLMLACGYLFTALMVVPHTLTFPGLFAPTGLLDAGPQSTAWLYMFWHGGLPVAVLIYALIKRGENRPQERPIAAEVLLALAVTVGAAMALAALATAGKAWLPGIMNGNTYTPVMIFVVSAVWALSLAALAVLWWRPPHTMLDLWLMVVMCAWLADIALSAVLNAGRFDLGFYAGRAYGFIAAISVLVILLFETGSLYAQLAKLFETEQQERRREAEERKRIFETSLDLILVIDRDGTLIRLSPSAKAILGCIPADLIGRNIINVVYPEDHGAIRAEMERTRTGQVLLNFAARCIHADGRIVTLAWSGVWSEPEQRYFFICRDVTEQKRNERMKDEFIATVSHELRTPITTIAGPLGLLVGGAAGELPAQAKRLLTIAESNSRRLVRLINDILDFERIESGKTKFVMQRINAKPLIKQAIAANGDLAEQFGVSVRLDVTAPDAAICADERGLMLVMSNLLSNAVKFSPRGSEAVVSIEPRPGHTRITVRDRGPGIPEEFRHMIFEKFAQIDATDARQKGGTGLGLSIVKETVARMGGSVGCGPGLAGGSIFYVDLPRWAANTDAAPESVSAA